MVNLNDRAAVTALDPKHMYDLTAAFADQCRRAKAIAEANDLRPLGDKPSHVILSGLGGSASGGDFAKALFEATSSVPFIVNREYHMPSYVGTHSIVICSSYSGNTEETLSSYADAKAAGARIIIVTSGGKLAELAKANGDDLFIVPAGQPPRTALGFMLIPVLVACVRLGLIPDPDFDEAFAALDGVARQYGVDAPDNDAKELARKMFGHLPILYGLGFWQGIVGYRWRCQINENSKNLCLTHAFPELCHNEILGWVKAAEQGVTKYVGVVLEDGTESPKMKKRMEVTASLVGDLCHFHSVKAHGNGLLAKMLSLVSIGDFVSIYLAALNRVDPENIDAINILKAELSKID